MSKHAGKGSKAYASNVSMYGVSKEDRAKICSVPGRNKRTENTRILCSPPPTLMQRARAALKGVGLEDILAEIGPMTSNLQPLAKAWVPFDSTVVALILSVALPEEYEVRAISRSDDLNEPFDWHIYYTGTQWLQMRDGQVGPMSPERTPILWSLLEVFQLRTGSSTFYLETTSKAEQDFLRKLTSTYKAQYQRGLVHRGMSFGSIGASFHPQATAAGLGQMVLAHQQLGRINRPPPDPNGVTYVCRGGGKTGVQRSGPFRTGTFPGKV